MLYEPNLPSDVIVQPFDSDALGSSDSQWLLFNFVCMHAQNVTIYHNVFWICFLRLTKVILIRIVLHKGNTSLMLFRSQYGLSQYNFAFLKVCCFPVFLSIGEYREKDSDNQITPAQALGIF